MWVVIQIIYCNVTKGVGGSTISQPIGSYTNNTSFAIITVFFVYDTKDIKEKEVTVGLTLANSEFNLCICCRE